MSFLNKLFGGAHPSSQRGVIVCQNAECHEQYHLDRIVTVSDDQLMGWLKGGGAVVIGDVSGQPILVGHSNHATNQSDLESLLKEAPKVGWQCNKCKAINLWSASY